MLDTLKIGDRVELLAEANFLPYATIPKGARGTVVQEGFGMTDVKLDTHHPGLSTFDNCIWLTDAADAAQVRRARALMPNWRKLSHALPMAAAFLAVLFVVALAPEALRAARGVPIVFHDMKILQDVLAPGLPLPVLTTSTRNRACIWEWQHSFYNEADVRVAWTKEPGVVAAATGIKTTYLLSIPTPLGLPDGRYRIANQGIGQCDHGDTYTSTPPDFWYTVKN